MNSIWQKSGKSYPSLKQDLITKTLVVGGGIAGYMAAYFLAESGQEVGLVEANKLFGGVTKNTTAFITALQGLVYGEIAKKHGIDLAKQYFLSQQSGINLISHLVEKHKIDCSFKILPTYLFSRSNVHDLAKEYKVLKELSAGVEWQNTLPKLNLKTTGVIRLDNQAQFHPIFFLHSLPQKFKVFEHSKVTEIDFAKKIAYIGKIKIEAQNIVVATHYPIFDLPEMFFAKMYQSQSYCQAYQSKTDLQGLYVEDIANGLTFRNYDKKIIIGGFDHRVGRTQKIDPIERLTRAANEVGLKSRPTHEWYAQDCMSFDLLPFAGKIAQHEGCFVITGFNKWGMASAAVGGQLVCDLINKKQNEYEKVFSSNRASVLLSPKKTASHFLVTIKSLIASLLLPLKNYRHLRKNSGGIYLVKGKKTGVFRDDGGTFHFVSPSCSHLGCQLKFNPHTQTFDCAYHGSRFSCKGALLSEPAVHNIKINTNHKK